MLIDKKKCWKELNLCLYFNQNHNIYYELLHGDKDTFKFAWLALKSKFEMIATEVGSCGYYNDNEKFVGQTMVQHDLNGNILFLHRNLLKWSKTKTSQKVWKKIRTFKADAQLKEYYITGRTMNIEGDVIELDAHYEIESMEEQCLNFYKELKSEPAYVRFIIAQFFQK
ncbi:hypothetical protein HK413_00950 [Mucilaginibacter sp. S1162]|uniref:Uncharacterized protein n=1 Tax=Mucilaginibacter humi TaxID=2732510 RepID=A0ABX1W3D6_9SPHI|nr:hypothetical protein [Mucilaginibacter humi]